MYCIYDIFFILKETEESSEYIETPKVTRQLPIIKVN